MLQAKVGLEPQVISPRTHLLTVIHLGFIFILRLCKMSRLSLASSLISRFKSRRKKIYFPHCMSLALTGSFPYPCRIFMVQKMQCIDRLRLSHTHLWRPKQNSRKHLGWLCGTVWFHRGKLEYFRQKNDKWVLGSKMDFHYSIHSFWQLNIPTHFFPYMCLKTCPHFHIGILYATKTQPLHPQNKTTQSPIQLLHRNTCLSSLGDST